MVGGREGETKREMKASVSQRCTKTDFFCKSLLCCKIRYWTSGLARSWKSGTWPWISLVVKAGSNPAWSSGWGVVPTALGEVFEVTPGKPSAEGKGTNSAKKVWAGRGDPWETPRGVQGSFLPISEEKKLGGKREKKHLSWPRYVPVSSCMHTHFSPHFQENFSLSWLFMVASEFLPSMQMTKMLQSQPGTRLCCWGILSLRDTKR